MTTVDTGVRVLPRSVRPEARLPSLLAMAGIAATLMFLARITFTPMFESPAFHMIPAKGLVAIVFWQGASAAASFFFVLSGFVLAWTVSRSERVRRFWRHRVLELYPTHLITLAATIVFYLTLMPILPVDFGVALLNAALIQAWFPDLTIWASFNSASWVVSCELLFVVCFPALMYLIRKISPERLWSWAIGIVAVIFVLPLAATALPDQMAAPYPGHDFTGVADSQFWFVTKFPPVRLLEFVFGILLARIVSTGGRLPFGVGGATVLLIVSYAVAPLFPLTYGMVAVMVVPIGLLIAAVATSDIAGRRTWLNSRVMAGFGDVSYAFYLWHLLILNAGMLVIGGGWSIPAGIAWTAALFAVTLLVSWLTVIGIERPLIRRFAAPRRVPSERAPAAA